MIEHEPKITKEDFIHASVRRLVIVNKRINSGVFTPRKNGQSYLKQMRSLKMNLRTLNKEMYTPRGTKTKPKREPEVSTTKLLIQTRQSPVKPMEL